MSATHLCNTLQAESSLQHKGSLKGDSINKEGFNRTNMLVRLVECVAGVLCLMTGQELQASVLMSEKKRRRREARNTAAEARRLQEEEEEAEVERREALEIVERKMRNDELGLELLQSFSQEELEQVLSIERENEKKVKEKMERRKERVRSEREKEEVEAEKDGEEIRAWIVRTHTDAIMGSTMGIVRGTGTGAGTGKALSGQGLECLHDVVYHPTSPLSTAPLRTLFARLFRNIMVLGMEAESRRMNRYAVFLALRLNDDPYAVGGGRGRGRGSGGGSADEAMVLDDGLDEDLHLAKVMSMEGVQARVYKAWLIYDELRYARGGDLSNVSMQQLQILERRLTAIFAKNAYTPGGTPLLQRIGNDLATGLACAYVGRELAKYVSGLTTRASQVKGEPNSTYCKRAVDQIVPE